MTYISKDIKKIIALNIPITFIFYKMIFLLIPFSESTITTKILFIILIYVILFNTSKHGFNQIVAKINKRNQKNEVYITNKVIKNTTTENEKINENYTGENLLSNFRKNEKEEDKYVAFLGGQENVINFQRKPNYLIVSLEDNSLIDESGLKSMGIRGIVRVGSHNVKLKLPQ